MTEKKSTLLAGLLIIAIGAAYMATIRPGHDWGGDFAMYIQHARNIAAGDAYARSGYIYNPSIPHIGPRAYPPVFPLFLAPVYRIFGFDLSAMKIEETAFFAAALFVIFLLFRRRYSPGQAMTVVGLIGFSPYFWSFKDDVMSDLPFLFLTFLALLVISRASQPRADGTASLAWAILSGFLIYLCFGTRAVGLALLPAIFAFDLINFKRVRKSTWMTAAAFSLFALSQSLLIREGGDYLDQIFLRPLSVAKNLAVYTDSLAALWNNGRSRLLQWVFFVLTVVLAVAGRRARKKKKATIDEIFLMIYLAVVLLWPFRQPRWLIPAIPLYLILVLEGIKALSRSKKKERLAMILFLAMAGISYVGAYMQESLGPIAAGPHLKESAVLFDYLKEHTDPADVFIFRKPRVLALYTGRRASSYHQAPDQDLWNYFGGIGAGFVIVSRIFPSDRDFLRPFIERNAHRLAIVYDSRDFTVYRMVKRVLP